MADAAGGRLEAASVPKKAKKEPAASYSRTGESRTTLGDGALNFRVRNGNGCDSPSVATGKRMEMGTKENHNPHTDAGTIHRSHIM